VQAQFTAVTLMCVPGADHFPLHELADLDPVDLLPPSRAILASTTFTSRHCGRQISSIGCEVLRRHLPDLQTTAPKRIGWLFAHGLALCVFCWRHDIVLRVGLAGSRANQRNAQYD
jgi:hypothetical protein